MTTQAMVSGFVQALLSLETATGLSASRKKSLLWLCADSFWKQAFLMETGAPESKISQELVEFPGELMETVATCTQQEVGTLGDALRLPGNCGGKTIRNTARNRVRARGQLVHPVPSGKCARFLGEVAASLRQHTTEEFFIGDLDKDTAAKLAWASSEVGDKHWADLSTDGSGSDAVDPVGGDATNLGLSECEKVLELCVAATSRECTFVNKFMNVFRASGSGGGGCFCWTPKPSLHETQHPSCVSPGGDASPWSLPQPPEGDSSEEIEVDIAPFEEDIATFAEEVDELLKNAKGDSSARQRLKRLIAGAAKRWGISPKELLAGMSDAYLPGKEVM